MQIDQLFCASALDQAEQEALGQRLLGLSVRAEALETDLLILQTQLALIERAIKQPRQTGSGSVAQSDGRRRTREGC
jgi:hypothetical protein